MLEALYKYFFKLLSIRPFGAIDLAVRRYLGVLFNEAATRADLGMIHDLATRRHRAIKRLLNPQTCSSEELPDIDIIMIADTGFESLQLALNALQRQSYPSSRVSLTVLIPEQHELSANPTLSDDFASAQYQVFQRPCDSQALTKALLDAKAPYFLLITSPFTFGEEALESILNCCVNSDIGTSLWEVVPTLLSRTSYYDPVSLEIPNSAFSCGVIKRESFEAVGGFDKQFPMSTQVLELSYRFRVNGYQLKNVGQAHLIQMPESDIEEPGKITSGDQRKTRHLLQCRYGSHLQRLMASLYLREKTGTGPSRLWGERYEISIPGTPGPNHNALGNQPKVSIIIRTFKGRGSWLSESICSVLNQTYPNLELIIVEDGSEEHGDLINSVRQSLRQGQTLKYLTQEKIGKSHAGNLGLANAEGQYIGFLDDDDLLFAHHVESLVRPMLADENEVGVYALAWEVQTSIEPAQTYYEAHIEVPGFTREQGNRPLLEKKNIFPIQSVLFDRSLYERYGGFDIERVYLEDWDLWLRYTQAKFFSYLPRVTSLYRTPANPYTRIQRISKSARRKIEQ